MGEIRKITQETKNRFLNLYTLDTVNRMGRNSHYYVASRAKEESGLKLRTGKNTPDGVAIYSLWGEKRDYVVLIRQYRYPLGGYVYELPAGLVEENEDFHETAVREMHEETGLSFTPIYADEIYEKPYFTSVGMTDESCAMVYGYASGEISQKYLEPGEEIEVVLADRGEVRRIMKEENMALICAYCMLHFLHDGDPFAFLSV